jgi:hypothetical protein
MRKTGLWNETFQARSIEFQKMLPKMGALMRSFCEDCESLMFAAENNVANKEMIA